MGYFYNYWQLFLPGTVNFGLKVSFKKTMNHKPWTTIQLHDEKCMVIGEKNFLFKIESLHCIEMSIYS